MFLGGREEDSERGDWESAEVGGVVGGRFKYHGSGNSRGVGWKKWDGDDGWD